MNQEVIKNLLKSAKYESNYFHQIIFSAKFYNSTEKSHARSIIDEV